MSAPVPFVSRFLPYLPPFDWGWQLDFLSRHAVHGLEEVADGAYARVFVANGQALRFTVADDPARSAVVLTLPATAADLLDGLAGRVRGMFDLDADPAQLEAFFARSPAAARLFALHPGVRLARGWDPFETAVLAILGQLVAVERGCALGRQLIESCGTVADLNEGGSVRIFPAPETLADAGLEAVKTTTARKRAIRAFARFYMDHGLERAALFKPDADPAELRARLLELPGVGPWTCEYVMLRAAGDADGFPATDLILKRALEAEPSLDPEAFRPRRGYLALLLWREYAAKLSKKRMPAAGRDKESACSPSPSSGASSTRPSAG